MSLTNFSKTLWSAGLLANVRKNLVAQSIATTEYEGEIQGQGSVVKILRPASVTSAPYTGTITYGNPTSTSLDLAVNQANYSAFKIPTQTAATTDVNLVNTYTLEASYKLAEDADGYVLKLPNVAAFDASAEVVDGTVASPKVYDALLGVAEKLDTNSVSRQGRYVIVSPKMLRALMKDADFIKASDVAQNILIAGAVGTIAGFSVFLSANFESVTGKANNTIAAGAGTQAYQRLHAGVLGNIAFADSVLAMRAMDLEGSFDVGVSGLHVFGASILKPEATIRIDYKTAN